MIAAARGAWRAAVAATLTTAACLGCAGTPVAHLTPAWERPGLGGAVRPEMGSPKPGDAAPELELPSTRGGRVRLVSLRGSWVLMHFTATWCPYCDAEVEHLGEVADQFAARGVKVLLIDVEEDPSLFGAYAANHVVEGVTPLFDADGSTAARWAPPHAQPSFDDRAQVLFDSTLLIDPEGTIRLFLLPDSAHFDPTFRAVREETDRLLTAAGRPEPPLLSAEQVVSVATGSATQVTPGGEAHAVVDLDVAPGYHVMAAHPSRDHYIPTTVKLAASGGVTPGDASYPPPRDFHFDGRAIATFQGPTRIIVPLRAAADAAPGPRVLTGVVRYQACTPSSCLVPATKPVTVPVLVAP